MVALIGPVGADWILGGTNLILGGTQLLVVQFVPFLYL